MNKTVFFLWSITGIFSMVLLSTCGPVEGFGTTTTLPGGETTTSTTTITPTNDYVFVFRPAFTSYYGSSIQSVEVGGSFNSWNFSSGTMTYVPSGNVYVFSNTLIGAEIEYLYKVTFDAPVPVPFTNAPSSNIVYFADSASDSYSASSLASLNSLLRMPSTNQLLSVSLKFSNLQEADTRVTVSRYIDSHTCRQDVNLIPGTNYFEYTARSQQYNSISLQIEDTNLTPPISHGMRPVFIIPVCRVFPGIKVICDISNSTRAG